MMVYMVVYGHTHSYSIADSVEPKLKLGLTWSIHA